MLLACTVEEWSCALSSWTVSIEWHRLFITAAQGPREQRPFRLALVLVSPQSSDASSPSHIFKLWLHTESVTTPPLYCVGVLVNQERRILSEQLRQTQIQPDSPATIPCVHGSFSLCPSQTHAFYSNPPMKSLPATWGPAAAMNVSWWHLKCWNSYFLNLLIFNHSELHLKRIFLTQAFNCSPLLHDSILSLINCFSTWLWISRE